MLRSGFEQGPRRLVELGFQGVISRTGAEALDSSKHESYWLSTEVTGGVRRGGPRFLQNCNQFLKPGADRATGPEICDNLKPDTFQKKSRVYVMTGGGKGQDDGSFLLLTTCCYIVCMMLICRYKVAG